MRPSCGRVCSVCCLRATPDVGVCGEGPKLQSQETIGIAKLFYCGMHCRSVRAFEVLDDAQCLEALLPGTLCRGQLDL